MKLGGMIPGFSKQRVCDELQRETITVSRVECSSSTGLNSELKMMEIPVQETCTWRYDFSFGWRCCAS